MEIFKKIKSVLNEPVYQVALILFLFEAAFIPSFSHPDTDSFCKWCKYIFEHGISSIYKIGDPDFNYPPCISYLLFAFGKFQGTVLNIDKYFRFFKFFGLLADFIVAVALVQTLSDKKREILLLLLLIANPVFIYNSYCWGQVDGVLSMFVFLSFVLLLRGQLWWSTFFFTLAFNFKPHAIIFLPPLVLLAHFNSGIRLTFKMVFGSVATFALTEILILFPFILNGEIKSVLKSFTGSVDYYQCTTCNAYNIWFMIVGEKSVWFSDKATWLNITYQHWGMIMFCFLSFLTLLPLLLAGISKALKRNDLQLNRDSLYIIFALISLAFFYFNTQMHERFGHTAILFVAAFSFSTRKYWLFLLICLAYFGNMEAILHYFNFPNYGVLIFNPYWVSCLYFLLILSLLYFLYKPFIRQLKNRRPSAAV